MILRFSLFKWVSSLQPTTTQKYPQAIHPQSGFIVELSRIQAHVLTFTSPFAHSGPQGQYLQLPPGFLSTFWSFRDVCFFPIYRYDTFIVPLLCFHIYWYIHNVNMYSRIVQKSKDLKLPNFSLVVSFFVCDKIILIWFPVSNGKNPTEL